MVRSLLTYLEDIRLAIDSIEQFIASRSLIEYKMDEQVQAAVERKLITVGEVFSQMELHFPGSRLRIDRVRDIVALRNLLVHDYGEINPGVVYGVIRGPMLALKAQVKEWIAELDPSTSL